MKNGETALHLACYSGKLDIIKLLHAQKADLNAVDNVTVSFYYLKEIQIGIKISLILILTVEWGKRDLF